MGRHGGRKHVVSLEDYQDPYALSWNDRCYSLAEKITILGSAIIGIGGILFAVAAFYKPRGPKGGRRMRDHGEGETQETIFAEPLPEAAEE